MNLTRDLSLYLTSIPSFIVLLRNRLSLCGNELLVIKTLGIGAKFSVTYGRYSICKALFIRIRQIVFVT